MNRDFNLPPGYTPQDTESDFGMKQCPECEGTTIDGRPDSIGNACPVCHGVGEIPMTYDEALEARQDADAERADRQRDSDIDRQMGL